MSFLSKASLSEMEADKIRSTVDPIIADYVQQKFGTEGNPQELADTWVEELIAGGTLASRVGLTAEHIDAFLSQAHALIKVGQLAKARDNLLPVLLLDPLEDRALYATAATLQMERRYAEAGRVYAAYIMMKALDPIGYLRMGECLLGDGAPGEAREFIEGAMSLARENDDATTAGHAEKLLEFIDKNYTAIHAHGTSQTASA